MCTWQSPSYTCLSAFFWLKSRLIAYTNKRTFTGNKGAILLGRKKNLRGFAFQENKTKVLAERIPARSIAVINHEDLDAVAAESLLKKRVKAVLNLAPSMTGRFDHNGVFISEWKGEQIGQPYGVAVTSNDKEVFVIDGGDQPDKTRSRVVVLNADGKVIESFNAKNDADEKNLGHDIAIGDGTIYVVDAWTRSVRKYIKHY